MYVVNKPNLQSEISSIVTLTRDSISDYGSERETLKNKRSSEWNIFGRGQ